MNVKSENYMDDDDDDDLLALIEDPIYLFHLIILHRVKKNICLAITYTATMCHCIYMQFLIKLKYLYGCCKKKNNK